WLQPSPASKTSHSLGWIKRSCACIKFVSSKVSHSSLVGFVMPPRKIVQKLEELCSTNVSNHVFSILSSWYQGPICSMESNISYEVGSREIQCTVRNDRFLVCSKQNSKVLQDYLTKNVPPRIRERILEKNLSRISQSIDIPLRNNEVTNNTDDVNFLTQLNFFLKFSLKCLLSKGITYLDLSPIAHILRKWKLSVNINVSDENRNDDKNPTDPYHNIFTNALNDPCVCLNTLKYLKLPHFVHDEFVAMVATHCTELEYLILNCSPDCSNPKGCVDAVQVLQRLYGQIATPESDHKETTLNWKINPLGCNKLKTLILPEGIEVYDDISDHGEEMLSHMKNLEYLVGIPMLFLSYIYDSLINSEQDEYSQMMSKKIERIKLQNFHHGAYNNSSWPLFVYEDDQQLDTSDLPFTHELLSVFRDVNEVSIYTSAEITEEVLKAFPLVQNITLFTDEFNIHGPYLKNLVKLDINVGYQDEWPILYQISCDSPKLEHLTLRSFSLQINENTDDHILASIKLPELQTLKLHGQYIIQQNALFKFLSGCPSLTSIYISMLADEDGETVLNDGVLSSIIPLMPNLHKFYFKLQCALIGGRVPPCFTIDTLNALVESCPQLSSIGQLDTWGISKLDLNNFYLKCKENNWDLEIN
ncbi:unnamed protein product, partial [Meganyctiphanes norvegica]